MSEARCINPDCAMFDTNHFGECEERAFQPSPPTQRTPAQSEAELELLSATRHKTIDERIAFLRKSLKDVDIVAPMRLAAQAHSAHVMPRGSGGSLGYGNCVQDFIAGAQWALRSAAPESVPSEHLLRNLLARIHRDGGHYTEAHGLEKASEDADVIVAALFAAQSVPSEAEAKALAADARLEADAHEADGRHHTAAFFDKLADFIVRQAASIQEPREVTDAMVEAAVDVLRDALPFGGVSVDESKWVHEAITAALSKEGT